jgi:hypothetical protein
VGRRYPVTREMAFQTQNMDFITESGITAIERMQYDGVTAGLFSH